MITLIILFTILGVVVRIVEVLFKIGWKLSKYVLILAGILFLLELFLAI